MGQLVNVTLFFLHVLFGAVHQTNAFASNAYLGRCILLPEE